MGAIRMRARRQGMVVAGLLLSGGIAAAAGTHRPARTHFPQGLMRIGAPGGLQLAEHFDSYLAWRLRPHLQLTGKLEHLPVAMAAAPATSGGTDVAAAQAGAAPIAGAPTNQPSDAAGILHASGADDSAPRSSRPRDWYMAGEFWRLGVTPLLKPLAALAGVIVLLRLMARRARSLRARPGNGAAASGPAEVRPAMLQEAAAAQAAPVHFKLETPAAPDLPLNIDGREVSAPELTARAEELDRTVADPELRNKLRLAQSYLGLGHLEAAVRLLDEIEQQEKAAGQRLFQDAARS